MLIRDAVLADLPAIVEIYNSTIASRMVTADLLPASITDKESWFWNHDAAKRPLWVVGENPVIAWMSFESFHGRPAYCHTAEISVYIHKTYRQQGLGSETLAYAISRCPQLAIKTLLAFIFSHNIPSIKLFEKFGFKVWGNFPRIAELDGVERSLLILGLRVSP